MPRIFLVWLVLASCIGWAVYQLKYEVQRLEDRLARVNRQILADQEAIQILKAEWSFLNQPAHLADLARRFLALEPVQSRQMVTVDALPMRREPTAPLVVAKSAAPPVVPSAPAARPLPPPLDLDEEATSAPADLPDEPVSAPDTALLLVKGVPQ
jgi:hypothetical protein